MLRRYFILLSFITFLPYLCIAQEDIEIIDNIDNEFIENNIKPNISKFLIGTILSFSGFNEFRMGVGLFLGELGSDGHHPIGYDYGLLFEYNFKENIIYTRLYGHLAGGFSAMLLVVQL